MIDNCGRYEVKAPRNMFNLQPLGGANASHCNYTVAGLCGEWDFVAQDGRLISSNKIASLVATYLSIRALDKAPCVENYSGGWWADVYRNDGFKSGSNLFKLNGKPATQETLSMAKAYAQQALAPLAKSINATIDITAKMATNRLIALKIDVRGLNNSMTGDYLNSGWVWKNNGAAR